MFKPILKAYSTSLLGVLSGLLTQMVYIRALAQMISINEFALYAFVFQITVYMSILQLGLDFATSREIALKLGKNDLVGANQSYLFIRRFNNKVCIGGFALVAICAALFYNGIGITSNFDYLMATKLVVLFGASMFISFLANPSIVALIGNNNQTVVNINNVVVTMITTIVGYILLKTTSLGVYALPICLVAFNSLNFFLLRSKAFKYCKTWLQPDNAISIPKGYNKSILQFSVISTIGGFAWTIEATSDVFILNGAGLLTLVGFYVLWWRFPQMFFDLATKLTTSAMPSLNTSFGRSLEEASLLFNRLLIVVGGIGFIIYAGIASCLTSFIYLWVGPQFFVDDFQQVSFLIGMLIYSRIIGNCFGMFAISIGRVKYSTTLSWIQAVVKVTFAIILVQRLGLKGLFIASIAGSLIQVVGCAVLLLKQKLLRKDVLVLIIMGYATPLILLMSDISGRVTLFQFLYVAVVISICSLLSWIVYIKIASLETKLNFNLSAKLFLMKLRKPRLNV